MAELISIKGTRNGLLFFCQPNQDFEVLKAQLIKKMETSKGFFNGAKFSFYIDKPFLKDEQTKELMDICCQHGLVPGKDTVIYPEKKHLSFEKTRNEKIEKAEAKAVFESFQNKNNVKMCIQGIKKEDISENCLTIKQSIRSGQKIQHKGNLIILGDVNSGAEIVASENIIISGCLRGTVHAGAEGNAKARIIAFCMLPEQIRIANKISRPPEAAVKNFYPEVAKLDNGQIIIEKYSGFPQNRS